MLCFVNVFAQQSSSPLKNDSVNIRAILLDQIAKIRNKEEQKSVPVQSRNYKQVPAKTASVIQESSSGSENIFIKIFILTDVSLGLILFVLWRRRNVKIKNVEKSWLKKNIMKLREDKITARDNKELRKLRKKLILEPITKSVNPEYISQFAKQQSISKGELLLAARLNSYKRVKDVNTGF